MLFKCIFALLRNGRVRVAFVRLTAVGKAYNYAHHLQLDQHQENRTYF